MKHVASCTAYVEKSSQYQEHIVSEPLKESTARSHAEKGRLSGSSQKTHEVSLCQTFDPKMAVDLWHQQST